MDVTYLPLYKKALELCVYIEQIVQKWDRYGRYTMGTKLREMSQNLLMRINRANLEKGELKIKRIKELLYQSEDLKMMIYLAKELKSLGSFKQFEMLSRMIVDVCRQTQAWYNKSIQR